MCMKTFISNIAVLTFSLASSFITYTYFSFFEWTGFTPLFVSIILLLIVNYLITKTVTVKDAMYIVVISLFIWFIGGTVLLNI